MTGWIGYAIGFALFGYSAIVNELTRRQVAATGAPPPLRAEKTLAALH